MAKAATARPFLLVPPNRERINEGEGKNSSTLYALNSPFRLQRLPAKEADESVGWFACMGNRRGET
jgi:hypothetical protein